MGNYGRLAGLFGLVDSNVVDAVAVEISDDWLVAICAKLQHLVAMITLKVTVGIQMPLAATEDSYLVNSISIEIADHGDVSCLAKLHHLVINRYATIAIGI
jgi:hypothetical protein